MGLQHTIGKTKRGRVCVCVTGRRPACCFFFFIIFRITTRESAHNVFLVSFSNATRTAGKQTPTKMISPLLLSNKCHYPLPFFHPSARKPTTTAVLQVSCVFNTDSSFPPTTTRKPKKAGNQNNNKNICSRRIN